MGAQILQRPPSGEIWAVAARQHGVISRRQLLDIGYTHKAIKHRLATGRLHAQWRGVYAVGRPDLTERGRFMAAVLSCGAEAVLSHESAGCHWGMRTTRPGSIDVSVPARIARRRVGVVVRRRASLHPDDVTEHHGIPVTTPICTLVDLATCLSVRQLEAAIKEADTLDLTDPLSLRSALDSLTPRPGIAVLRRLLDRWTFTLTDSELERRFLRLVRSTSMPAPQTGRRVNGFKVDFYWPDLGLVVETDGLRYHRTPAQQARDRVRDQAHAAAGLTALRFTHSQVTFERHHVRATLAAVAGRISHAR